MDVIALEVPLIIGLDALKSQRVLVNYIDNILNFCNEDTKQPFTYKFGHVSYKWDQKEILFTHAELTCLHLHFMHRSSDRIFDLIGLSESAKVTPSIRKIFESITDAWSTFQSFKYSPFRFNASITQGHLIFNNTILIDLVWLDEKLVLQVID